jgi:hypothetical protein
MRKLPGQSAKKSFDRLDNYFGQWGHLAESDVENSAEAVQRPP